MLISTNNQRGDTPSELDNIHNYYQRLVFEELHNTISDEDWNDSGYIADIACVALNHLPPRYIRYSVDMAFYLSPDENAEMTEKVKKAVANAIDFVNRHSNR